MTLRPTSLFWKLFLGTSVLLALVLCACTVLILMRVDAFHEGELTDHLRDEALTVRQAVAGMFDRAHAAELDRFVKERGHDGKGRTRITMILADGTVVADSEANAQEMESHATRKEVQQALAEGWGEDLHYSQTVAREMKYVAIRVGDEASPAGVIRVSMARRMIAERRGAIRELVWTITVVGLIAAVLFAMGLARVWSRPIADITAIAHSLSRGDLSARAGTTGNDEMAILARALNEMRERLTDQIETMDRQRRTLESLLAQLQEGVVLAGPDKRILLMNPAAIRFLRSSPAESLLGRAVVGSTIEECVHQHELQRLLLPVSRAEDQARAAEVLPLRIKVDSDEGERSLLARASEIELPRVTGESQWPGSRTSPKLGRLLVLTDITELDHTVQVKMDFASNASHELRTPLATIRAAVETLTELDWAAEPETAHRFLAVIDRQGGRMEQMVSDLLDLSKVESSQAQFEPQTLDMSQLLSDLKAGYRDRFEAGQLTWAARISADLGKVTANPYLLRTILENLVDNAIKFTESSGEISVCCNRETDAETGEACLAITVGDTGCGISEDEQTRVFERFYQVEQSRSGAVRGSGLGLSIVRHAIAAMGGTVSLESKLGEGTCVTIRIPQQGA